MKLSVLITTYNQRQYIREALDSVLMQDVDFDYEVVVGDDASTDSTPAILKEYAEKYPGRFHLLLRERHMGPASNFYATLEACGGQYVALLEGEDYWTSSQKLKKQVAFLDKNQDYVCCFHNVTGHFEEDRKPDFGYVRPDFKGSVTLEDLLSENVIPSSSAVFRRGLVNPLPSWVFDSDMAQYPLHILNAQYGKVGYFDEFMGINRLRRADREWPGQNGMTRLQASTKMLKHLVQTLGGRQRSAAMFALARRYWDLVGAYEIRNEHRTARRYALMSLQASWVTGSPTLRDKLTVLARLSAPTLYGKAIQVYGSVARADQRHALPSHPAPSNPRVSVVIPAYNAQRYLFESIHSVLSQTYEDFECIVVDDGSTDRTPGILAELALRDARVKPLRIRHSGIVEALNAGVNAANGELIARMDADDVCLPERFQKQVDYLDQHPECIAVGSEVMLVDPFGSTLWKIEVKTEHDQIDADLLSGDGWAMFHPTTMLRRKGIIDVGGYRPQYQWAEDMDLFLRLAEIGRLANLPEVLLRYRQHFASVNRTKLEIQRHRSERVIIEAYRRRGKAMPAGFQLHMTPQLTRYEQVRAWCQRALMTGNAYAARRHALAALRFEPLRYDSWSLIYHAVAGR